MIFFTIEKIVFFIPDYEWYCQEANRDLLYKYDDVTPGHKVTSWNGVQSILTEIFEGSTITDFSNNRKETLDFFYSERGLDNADLFNKCKDIS